MDYNCVLEFLDHTTKLFNNQAIFAVNGWNVKSECIVVSAMVHLPQEKNFGSPTSLAKWC